MSLRDIVARVQASYGATLRERAMCWGKSQAHRCAANAAEVAVTVSVAETAATVAASLSLKGATHHVTRLIFCSVGRAGLVLRARARVLRHEYS